jgi:hypothetical protein
MPNAVALPAAGPRFEENGGALFVLEPILLGFIAYPVASCVTCLAKIVTKVIMLVSSLT